MSERRLRVGLVTEPGGIDDPYNRGAYLGLERAVRELGIRGRVLTPAPKEGYGNGFGLFPPVLRRGDLRAVATGCNRWAP